MLMLFLPFLLRDVVLLYLHASSAFAIACVYRPPLARRFNPYDFEAAPSISVESTSSAAAFPTSRLQAACSWAARKQMVMKQVLPLADLPRKQAWSGCSWVQSKGTS